MMKFNILTRTLARVAEHFSVKFHNILYRNSFANQFQLVGLDHSMEMDSKNESLSSILNDALWLAGPKSKVIYSNFSLNLY